MPMSVNSTLINSEAARSKAKSFLALVLERSIMIERFVYVLILNEPVSKGSKLLLYLAEDNSVPISTKIRLLKEAELIDKNLYKNLDKFFRIRNRFAHKEAFFAVEDMCKELDIDYTSLETLDNVEKAYLELADKCYHELYDILWPHGP